MISGSFIAKTTNSTIRGTVNWSSTLDSLNNQSTVTASMTLRKYPPATIHSEGVGTWNLYINDVRHTITENKDFTFGVDTLVISNTVVVPHNADGSKVCNIRVTGGMPAGNTYTETYASYDATLELNVVKAVILTAPDFTDLENPTITFANPRNYPVQFKIEDRTGNNNLITTSKLVDYNLDYYTFELTEEQRDILRTAAQNYSEFPIRFTVSSYIPEASADPTYFSWLDRTMTIVDGEPTFTDFHHEDINPTSVALTGDSSVYIQNLSQCKRWVAEAEKMVANKLAIPKGYTAIFGDTSNYANYSPVGDIIFPTININYLNPNLTVKAIDSRNKTTTVVKPITIIPYDKTSNYSTASVYRQNGFQDTIIVNIQGEYTPILVGGVEKNDVSLNIKYKLDGHANWDYDQSFHAVLNTADKSFSYQTTFNLPNTNQYIFEVNVWDYQGAIGNLFNLTVPKGETLFYIGADKKLGVNKVPDGADIGLYLKTDDHLWSQLYPIGAVYTCIETMNPESIFTNMEWSAVSGFNGLDGNVYLNYVRLG